MLVSLNIKMLSTSALLYAHTGQSESVLCQGEERERERDTQKREEERKSKSNHASGRDKWELSKNVAAPLARLKVVTLI